ncbi:MAG: hypothetical protein ABS79_06610 [Planctomycetes bacterium SCN 63-9]|nr:MAG: hypothetical protein ABS79_06610 [Planctomycetes bacterium SCN 63-9]
MLNSKSKQTIPADSRSVSRVSNPTRREFLTAAGVAGLGLSIGSNGVAQQNRAPDAPPIQLVPELKTTPVRHDQPLHNFQMVNVKPLPKDREGIWVLDFAFKPLRIKQIENPNRQQIHYLYYKVVNRTGAPRIFVPQFYMVNEAGTKYPDTVIPRVIPLIRAREDATIPLLGSVTVMGTIPPSTKQDVDDAVYGVAVWDKWDPHADRFSIYVRGLSDGYKELPPSAPGKPPVVKYKTLKIDFIRRGDERNLSEREIQLNDPPTEWVYW